MGDTETEYVPDPFSVAVADDGPAHVYVTTEFAVPLNVSGVLAPETILAVPAIVAVGKGLTVTVGLPVADCEQPDKLTVAVYVVVEVGVTLALPAPEPLSVNEATPPLRLNVDNGVPPDTEIFVDDPLHIAAVPVIVAVGNAFTVTVALPDVADVDVGIQPILHS